jgi:hypothetical protein
MELITELVNSDASGLFNKELKKKKRCPTSKEGWGKNTP